MKILNIVILLFYIIIIGCGREGNNGKTQIKGERVAVIRGKVLIEAEIANATLFLDLNLNGELDSSEPYTKTDNSGSFILQLKEKHLSNQNYRNLIVPIVAFGGKDIRSNRVFDGYLMAIREDNRSTVYITPLTTLIAETLQGESYSTDKILDTKSRFAKVLGVEKELIDQNPIDLIKDGDSLLINSSLKLYYSIKEINNSIKDEFQRSKKDILKIYKVLANELLQIKNFYGDKALILAIDRTTKDSTKEATKRLIDKIDTFWRLNNHKKLSDTALDGLIKSFITKLDNIAQYNNYPYIPTELNSSMAIRFLNKASFGATSNLIKEIQKKGVVEWIDEQLNLPLNDKQLYLRKMIELAKEAEPRNNPYSVEEYLADNDIVFNKSVASKYSPDFMISSWYDTALKGKDQLRAKLTYALSQIIVESNEEPFFNRRSEAIAHYFDILRDNAFKSYKDVLMDISFSSGMGIYLTYNGNKKLHKNSSGVEVYPDENYAREIMQLFSIGLHKLNIDGTPQKNINGNLIPTYTQKDVNEIARVFTGWDLKRGWYMSQDDNDEYGKVVFRGGDFTHTLEFTDKYHDFEAKEILGQTIPAGISGEEDIESLINILMDNPNTAPFISKNLIMRLTKSNPSSNYIRRVATIFNDTNGDLKEVTRAIFLDKELWSDIKNNKIEKFKEPQLAYTEFLRALNAKPLSSWYFCNGAIKQDKSYNCGEVKNKFLFKSKITKSITGQGAGFAPTVFNFYDNQYIPNNSKFRTSNLVAPELQIQSDTVFMAYSNEIYNNLVELKKSYNLSIEDELTLLTDKVNGVKKLIDYLDMKFTAGVLSMEEKELLYNFFKDRVSKDREKLIVTVIYPAIRAIVTSDKYMVE